MLTIAIPGTCPDGPHPGMLLLEHLVLDYNGTLALDGQVLPGVKQRLEALAVTMNILVLTADTFGSVHRALDGFPLAIRTLPAGGCNGEDRAKLDVLEELGPDRCAFFGQGRNDVLALEAAALGIGVLQEEGMHAGTLSAADVVVQNILHGLDLLIHTDRLKATLRF